MADRHTPLNKSSGWHAQSCSTCGGALEQ
jgi:hypothetical protein